MWQIKSKMPNYMMQADKKKDEQATITFLTTT
jgi:hypothetical protein